MKENPTIDKIILVTIDTLRSDHLGCYGYIRNTTPFLDSIASKGILFENTISQSSHTQPSHASIFTSLYPFQHGSLKNGQKLSRKFLTLPRLMRQKGFETAAFTSVKFLKKLKDGFEVFIKGTRERDGKQTIDQAINWLEGKSEESKFFLWIHLYDVHDWKTKEGYNKTHAKTMNFDGPEKLDHFLNFLADKHHIPLEISRNNPLILDMFKCYDAQLLFVDKQLERLFKWMDDKNLNNQSLWIFTSDHGEGLGNHNYLGHGKLIYNEQLRVPMLVYCSDNPYPPRKIKNLVRLVDIFPTIADLLDISLDGISPSISGDSFLPLMKNKANKNFSQLGFSERRPKDEKKRKTWEKGKIASLQNLEYKYIYHQFGKDEFFNLATDPLESHNLLEYNDNNENKGVWLKRKILKILNTNKFKPDKNKEDKLDEETIKELKSLGYL